MSPFLTDLPVLRRSGSRERQLLADLQFEYRGRIIVVPKGFIYNGPSFPIIWGGDGEMASAVHDYMYSRPDLFTRELADEVLRAALEAEGMNAVRRSGWWLGVRLFGARHYDGPQNHVAPNDQLTGG